MKNKVVCEVAKNTRERIILRLGEYKGHRFVDLRVFVSEDGQDPVPTKKGLTVAPHLWPQFKAALARVEEAMIAQGWLSQEDLEADHDF